LNGLIISADEARMVLCPECGAIGYSKKTHPLNGVAVNTAKSGGSRTSRPVVE